MKKRIIVKDIIEDELAVTAEKGRKFYEVLKENVIDNNEMVIDFTGISILVSPFSNASFAKLYNVAEPEVLSKLVKVDRSTINNLGYSIIIKSLQRGKEVHTAVEKEKFEKALREDLESGN